MHNQDIAPRDDPRYPDIGALLKNEELWQEFGRYEARANALKQRYARLGVLSVLLIGGGALYATFRWVAADLIWYRHLDLPVAVIGLAGLILDTYLRRSKLKTQWLINRFAAERLRSVKFQVYAASSYANDAAQLTAIVEDRTKAMIQGVRQELNIPEGALDSFHPPSAIALDFLPPPPAVPSEENQKFLRQAVADYRQSRIRYQHVFAKNESRDIAGRQRPYNSWSDALFVLGAFVLFAGLSIRFFAGDPGLAPEREALANWLEAIGIAFFIGTAIGNVLSSGSANLAHESRFQQYARDTQHLLSQDPQTPDDFVALIREMERLALRELDDFWRDSWIGSYR